MYSQRNIFFIGIGGVSMSALAEILHRSARVSGSDDRSSHATKRLADIGINVCIGHAAANITADIDLVVATAAIPADNPELIAARERGIEIISRAALLGAMAKGYANSIAVAGAHGKTTTTALVADLLLIYDPTVLIGARFPKLGGNYRIGGSDIIVFEACEYQDSFLSFFPKTGVILNFDIDHLDYFESEQQLIDSYRAFAGNCGEYLIINRETRHFDSITKDFKGKIITFGTGGDYSAVQLTRHIKGTTVFDIHERGSYLCRVESGLIGTFNIENMLAAAAVCRTLYPALETRHISDVLARFRPASRRYETKGTYHGAVIIDDYAHHPTEIKRTLASAKAAGGKVICLFQPHTYTRTKALYDDFAHSFSAADEVALVPIYPAREPDLVIVSSRDLAASIAETGIKTLYFENFEEARMFYSKNLTEGDLFITMGAGDVYLIGESLLHQSAF